jgi:hypothetical protein
MSTTITHNREYYKEFYERCTSDLQAGQNLHRFAAVIEGGRRAPHGLHAPLVENHPQKLIYLARALLPNRFGRFFPWCVSNSSAGGRRRQISALVPTKSRLISWNLRNSATSRWALRMAAAVGKDWEMVLPSTL